MRHTPGTAGNRTGTERQDVRFMTVLRQFKAAKSRDMLCYACSRECFTEPKWQKQDRRRLMGQTSEGKNQSLQKKKKEGNFPNIETVI
jgi:hypothetical protein